MLKTSRTKVLLAAAVIIVISLGGLLLSKWDRCPRDAALSQEKQQEEQPQAQTIEPETTPSSSTPVLPKERTVRSERPASLSPAGGREADVADRQFAELVDEISTEVSDISRGQLRREKDPVYRMKRDFHRALDDKESFKIWKLIDQGDEKIKAWMGDELILQFKDADNDPSMRKFCLSAVYRLEEHARKLAVEALISDPDRYVRKAAARVLDYHATEAEIEPLYQAVRADKGVMHNGRDIARVAIGALGMIHSKRAGEVLIEIWNNPGLVSGCREVALNSLGQSGNIDTYDILVGALHGKYQSERNNALLGLSALAQLNAENRELKAKVLDLVRTHAEDKNPDVRIQVARSLGGMGEDRDLEILEALLEDPHSRGTIRTENGQDSTITTYPVRKAAAREIKRLQKRVKKQS